MNRNLSRGKSSATRDYSRSKLTTREELLRFYGLFLIIGNTYGNSVKDLRKHLQKIKETEGKVKGLGQDRFVALWGSFNPSITEIDNIVDILHASSMRYQSYTSAILTLSVMSLKFLLLFLMNWLLDISLVKR